MKLGLMVEYSIILALVYGCYSAAKSDTIKVAVVDTGFDFSSDWNGLNFPKPKICPTGHVDFTMKLKNKSDMNYLKDNHGHGTHVAGLISKSAGDSDYCLVILKYYDPVSSGNDNLLKTLMAFTYSIKQNVDIINYSGGGINKSDLECQYIKKALDQGIIVIAAAGNEHSDLDKNPYYPAMCDDRVIMVSSLDIKNKSIRYDSNLNYDIVAIQGTYVNSLLPNNRLGVMSGTSQSTATLTGKIIRILNAANIKRSNQK